MDRILTFKRARVYFHMYNMFFQILLALLVARVCLDYLSISFFEYLVISILLSYSGSLVYSKIYVPIHLMNTRTGRNVISNVVTYFMFLFMAILSIILGWMVFTFTDSIFTAIYAPTFFFFGALWWDVTFSQLIGVVDDPRGEGVIK